MKLAVVLGAVAVIAIPAADASPRVDATGTLIRGADSCGTTRTPAPVAVATPYAAQGVRVIYLNPHGGTYNISNGATDAATNTANTIAAGDGRTHMNAVIPPIESSFDWPYIVACVKAQYKPYNVIVTESEPTSGSYVEAVVGGDGASTGWSRSSGILGVASADNFCGVTDKGIAFSFASNHVGISRPNDELCATIAHEVGHLLSLEHEISTPDTMSYVPFATAGQKSFTSANSQCGTDAQDTTSCSCPTTGAGEVTSSAMRLTQYLGLRPTETNPPTLSVTSPSKDATVRPAFTVTATASDDTAMAVVSVLVDGVEVASSLVPQGTTYTIAVPAIAEGKHTLEVQAIDLAGNVTKDDRSITAALGATGESCTANADCHGNICAAETSGDSFCTQTCDPSNSCPDDFSCQPVGAQQVCVPSDGGGCSTHGGGGDLLWLALVGLIPLRRLRGTRKA